MMCPVIRCALQADVAVITDLACQLGYPADEKEIFDRLRLLTGREEHVVLLAELEGSVVGWIHAFTAHRLESPPFVEIGGLIIDGAHRGRGLGRRLVFAVIAWAKTQGVHQLRVRSSSVRGDAHQFYGNLGFLQVKTQLVFVLPVPAA